MSRIVSRIRITNTDSTETSPEMTDDIIPTAADVEELRRAWHKASLLAVVTDPKPDAQALAVDARHAYEDAQATAAAAWNA